MTIGRSSSSKIFFFLFFKDLPLLLLKIFLKNVLPHQSFSSKILFFNNHHLLQKSLKKKSLLLLLLCVYVLKFKSLWMDSGWTNGGMTGVSQLAVPIFGRSGFHERSGKHSHRRTHTHTGTDRAGGKVKRFHMCKA